MLKLILLGLVSAAASYDYKSVPGLNYDTWWGPPGRQVDDPRIIDFKIKFSNEMIDDLKCRLKHTREFVPSMDGVEYNYGVNTHTFGYWQDYWLNKYNFTEREAYINKYPHKKTMIQGLWIHYIHIKPKVPKGKIRIPVLLLHGYPGSILEFYDAIPLLIADSPHRNFVLELIIPSLPGYAYSDYTNKTGLGAADMVFIFRNLMFKLGFKKFLVEGGDWGAIIGSTMATFLPEICLGYHTTMGVALTNSGFAMVAATAVYPAAVVQPITRDRLYPLVDSLQYLAQESGYFHMLASKPDTVGICMTQSPISLAGWILQLFSVFSSRDGINSDRGGLDLYTPEQLIDNLMLYWAPNKGASSIRIYAETFNERNRHMGYINEPTPVPTVVIQAKNELFFQSDAMLGTKFENLIDVQVLPNRGHFLALEAPEEFANSVLCGTEKILEFRRINNMTDHEQNGAYSGMKCSNNRRQ